MQLTYIMYGQEMFGLICDVVEQASLMSLPKSWLHTSWS